MLLIIILINLLIGILAVCLCNDKHTRFGAFLVSVLCFFFSTALFADFDNYLSFQHLYIAEWIPEFGITFCIGVDGLSLFFVLLTTFIMPITILSTWESIKQDLKTFYASLLFIEFFLILAFSSLDIFLFYFSFESVLIPMILIIILWGQRTRRVKAAYYFFFFTFIGSFFMLLSVLYINVYTGTTNYLDILHSTKWLFSKKEELWLWLGFFVAFAVKVPMYPFHIWLPEAHVEAPTSGSMILAGLLLKLGGYGFLRFSIGLFPYASQYYSSLIYVIAIISVIYASCCALVQIDFKKLIAYSSIAHMNMAILGIFSNNFFGLWGGFVMMLGHGLSSVALFFLAGCLYDRYHQRLIEYYGGLSQSSPVLTFFMFYFITSNFGFPYNVNFLAEVFIIAGVFKLDFFVLMLLGFSLVIGLAYNIYFYERVFLGTVNTNYIKVFMDMSFREIVVVFPLFFWGLVLFFKPDLLSVSFEFSFYNYFSAVK